MVVIVYKVHVSLARALERFLLGAFGLAKTFMVKMFKVIHSVNLGKLRV